MEQKIKIDCVIGVDPGKQGGIAIYERGVESIKTVKMPESAEEMAELFRYYRDNFRPIAFLEKLNLHRDDMSIPGKVFGIQKLMANFEQLKTALELVGIPYCLVHPLSWEHRLGLRQKGLREEKAERKRRYAAYAGRLYPLHRVTLWNSDAILLMHFGRAVLANDLQWVLGNLPEREQGKLF